jgi:hypothetical protein
VDLISMPLCYSVIAEALLNLGFEGGETSRII